MEPFRIICMTCNAPLRVRDAALIGHILPCPKCNSMVEVVAPEGTMPEEAPSTTVATVVSASALPPATPAPTPVPDALGEFPTVPQSATAKWIAIGSAGTVVAAALIGGIIFSLSGDKAAEPPIAASTPDEDGSEQADVDLPKLNEVASVSEHHEQVITAPATSEPEQPEDVPATVADTEVKDPETAGDEHEAAPTGSALANHVDETGRDIDATAVPAKTPAKNDHAVRVADEPSTGTRQFVLPPADIDVTARLSMRLGEAKFTKVPLHRFLATMSAISAVPIEYDAATLARVGRESSDVVSIDVQDAPLGEILKSAVHRWGLVPVPTGPRVMLTVPDHVDAPLRSIRYGVGDLARGTGELDRLVELLQAVVSPRTWQENGGRGTINVTGTTLQIKQSMDVQIQVLVLCEKLRVARGIDPKSRMAPRYFDLASRHELAKVMLARTVTIRPADNATLRTVAEQLGHGDEINVAIDELALLKAGKSGLDPVQIEADGEPLGEALSRLLEPNDLVQRVVNHRVIEITTPSSTLSSYHVEFYSVQKLAAASAATDRLQARIEREIAPRSWQNQGGKGVIFIDEKSPTLVVFQTAANHIELETTLNSWQPK